MLMAASSAPTVLPPLRSLPYGSDGRLFSLDRGRISLPVCASSIMPLVLNDRMTACFVIHDASHCKIAFSTLRIMPSEQEAVLVNTLV